MICVPTARVSQGKRLLSDLRRQIPKGEHVQKNNHHTWRNEVFKPQQQQQQQRWRWRRWWCCIFHGALLKLSLHFPLALQRSRLRVCFIIPPPPHSLPPPPPPPPPLPHLTMTFSISSTLSLMLHSCCILSVRPLLALLSLSLCQQ